MNSCLPEPVFAIHTITGDLIDNGVVLSSGFLQQIKGEKRKELIMALKHLNLEELVFQDAEDALLIVLGSHFDDQIWLVKNKNNKSYVLMLSSEI